MEHEAYLAVVLRMVRRSDLREESKAAIEAYLEETLASIGRVRAIARQIMALPAVQDDHRANLDHYGDPPADAYSLAQLLLQQIGDDRAE